MASTGDASTRRPALDGLRGVAILLVVIGHGGANHRLGGLAASGVTLFFALSGYLITGNLLREHALTGRVRLSRFYWRRLTRLGPSLFVMVAVVTIGVGGLPWQAVAQALTWTTDLAAFTGWDYGPFGLTWSLAVEEQFYLLWPLALGLLLARRHPILVLAGVTLALMYWRGYLLLHGEYVWGYSSPEVAGTSILAGCLVAMARLRCSAWVGAGCLAFTVAAGLASTLIGGPLWLYVPLVVTPAAACLVAAAEQLPLLTWRPLTFCGVVSYSVYLWHEPGGALFGFDLLTPGGTLIGVALGLVAYFAVEAPVMHYRSAHQARATARRAQYGAVTHGAGNAADATPAAAVQLA